MHTDSTLLVLPSVAVVGSQSCCSFLTVCLAACLCRLFILGSYDRETYVHCTLELSSHQWKEKTRSSIKRVSSPPSYRLTDDVEAKPSA